MMPGRVTGAGVLIAVALSLGMAIPQAARANHYCAANARSEGALVQLWRGTKCKGASVVANGWRPNFKAFDDAATGQVVDVNNDISSVAIKPGHCVRFWGRSNYQGDPSTILCTPPDPEDNAMSSISFDDRAASLKVCADDRKAECNADGPPSSLGGGGGGGGERRWRRRDAHPDSDPHAGGIPAAVGNQDPTFLQVYDNNVENLETPTEYCKGDWQDLVYFMKLQKYAPDLFLVQQVSGRAQLNELTEFMTRNLPGRYKGVIARRKPQPFDSPCNAPKARQTNAIVFRVGRFDVQPDPSSPSALRAASATTASPNAGPQRERARPADRQDQRPDSRRGVDPLAHRRPRRPRVREQQRAPGGQADGRRRPSRAAHPRRRRQHHAGTVEADHHQALRLRRRLRREPGLPRTELDGPR